MEKTQKTPLKLRNRLGKCLKNVFENTKSFKVRYSCCQYIRYWGEFTDFTYEKRHSLTQLKLLKKMNTS